MKHFYFSEFEIKKEGIQNDGNFKTNLIEKLANVIQVPDSVSMIQDQIAMESVNKYLRNMYSHKGQQISTGMSKPFIPTPIGKNHEEKTFCLCNCVLVFHGSTTVIPNVLQRHKV